MSAFRAFAAAALFCIMLSGCVQVSLLPDPNQPLQEAALEGTGSQKVLLVPVRGFISTRPEDGLLQETPGVVQRVSMMLEKASKDDAVAAVVLAVDSPGGTATGSRALYREILRFKDKRKIPVIAAQMEVAASGGYYACAAADWIVAHPTTVTGSVGTIFLRPKVDGLLGKIGADVEVTKSGRLKDMGSPFRATTSQESRLFGDIVLDMNGGFLDAVAESRHLGANQLAQVATARIYTGAQAQKAGLVDELGTLRDALQTAKNKAGLPEDAKVVTYRRSLPADDTVYNPTAFQAGGAAKSLLDLGPMARLLSLESGFYHLWLPETR